MPDLPPIRQVDTTCLVVPTEEPETDGTAAWEATTVVIVEVAAGDHVGLGFTYGAGAAATVVRDLLEPLVVDRSTEEIPRLWRSMYDALRNVGAPGIAATAVSAMDVALWDLHARLVGQPLVSLIGGYRDAVPVYGSGGFTSMSDAELTAQLAAWAEAGMRAVKMKIGREPARDAARVAEARRAIGPDVRLMVDANGAYRTQQALALARCFAERDVCWFEEPVSSDHVAELRFLRERVPPGMEVAAGEYGWSPWAYDSLLREAAVDVVQADVTRCGGFSGFAAVAARADGAHLPVSAHCAPHLSSQVAACFEGVRDVEWFADHARVESLLFDGACAPIGSRLLVDRDAPGHGLTLRRPDIERWRA